MAKEIIINSTGDVAVGDNHRIIHESVNPPANCEELFLVKGPYDYFYYNCDNIDDRGWGCGYRTLQTLCSWVHYQQLICNTHASAVPGLQEIQKALVAMSDKPTTFEGSRDWIGSVEVGLCVDYFYEVPCKIMHIKSGGELKCYTQEIISHFKEKGSPIMMGGNSDAASKAVIGISKTKSSYFLLILDPHYVGPPPDGQALQDDKMLLWRPIESFMTDSFYNLCMPQLAAIE